MNKGNAGAWPGIALFPFFLHLGKIALWRDQAAIAIPRDLPELR